MPNKSIILYKQAQSVMKGIFWDYEKNPITHVSSIVNSSTTACGLRIRGPEYGWRELKNNSDPSCPACRREFDLLKKKSGTSVIIATS